MDLYSWILALAIISGQLIKLPIVPQGGMTVLDLTVVALCLLGLTKLKLKLTQPPLFLKSAMVFIFIAILSLILTPLHLQPQEILTSFFYTARFTIYILLSWLIISDAFPTLRNNIPRILIFSGLSVAVLGLIQFVFLPDLRFLTKEGWDPHYFRTVSTFLDPNFAGAFFVLTLILTFQNLAMAKKWNTVFSIIIYAALLTTFSRSSYLMFLISGLTLSFLKKTKSTAILSIVLFLGLMLGFYIYTKTISQPRNIDRTQSASSRLNTWQQGFTIFQKFFSLGIGYNAYRYGLKELKLGDEHFLQSHGASSNDSSLLFVASTTGIIGLISYLLFLFSLIYKGTSRMIILPAILGLLSSSLFANSLFYPPILAWILLVSVIPKK